MSEFCGMCQTPGCEQCFPGREEGMYPRCDSCGEVTGHLTWCKKNPMSPPVSPDTDKGLDFDLALAESRKQHHRDGGAKFQRDHLNAQHLAALEGVRKEEREKWGEVVALLRSFDDNPPKGLTFKQFVRGEAASFLARYPEAK